MMNCGKKKYFHTTSSASLISNVSLKTWLLRFKKKKDGAEPVSGNATRKWNKNPVSPMFDNWNESRAYFEDDGLYWRISFDKQRYEDEVILHNSDYQLNVSPVSSEVTIQATYEDRLKSTVDNSRTRRSKHVLNSGLQTIVEDDAIKDLNLEEEWQKLCHFQK